MIYRNDAFGEKKHYSLSNNGMGIWTLREFANRIKRTEMTLNTEEKIMFTKRLEDNGWYPSRPE